MYLWDRSIKNQELCGCGKKVVNCEIWKGIFEKAEEYNLNVFKEAKEAQKLLENFWWMKKAPLWSTKKYKEISRRYIDKYMTPLYQAIFDTRSEKIIVDSSKNIGYLYLLMKMGRVDLYIIHMIRNCKAVAFSWKRKRERKEYILDKRYMPQFKVHGTALRWGIFNQIIAKMASRGNYLPVTYEQFTQEPQKTMDCILRFAGLSPRLLFSGGKICFKANHTVAGNPNRLKHGDTIIKTDDEWKDHLPVTSRLVIDFLSLPFFLGYKRSLKP